MEGIESDPGIVPRVIEMLFSKVHQITTLGWTFKMEATALQIKNEIISDLLAKNTKPLEIRLANKNNLAEVCVPGLTVLPINTKRQLQDMYALARQNRETARTAQYATSSRSHFVVQIKLNAAQTPNNETVESTINLIDLAGSKSPKMTTDMKTTAGINTSIRALKSVMEALRNGESHVPYRNSKLTHLLMPSLSGDSKTLMFVNVSPIQDCLNETVRSLNFATSENKCQIQKHHAPKSNAFTSSHQNRK